MKNIRKKCLAALFILCMSMCMVINIPAHATATVNSSVAGLVATDNFDWRMSLKPNLSLIMEKTVSIR